MSEVWKDIPGYEKIYQVSNLGRVKSLNYRRTKKEKLLQFAEYRNNYFFVDLSKNGVTKQIMVHRLVAQAFVPNPKNKTQVNHIDGDKHNNRVENLEWTTARENMNHSRYVLGNCAENALKKKIKCVETGQIFESAHEASRVMKIGRANICKAARIGKIAGGYHWKWV